MKRALLLATVGLVGGAVLGPPAIAAADKLVQDVFVTNTSDNPVPVNGTVNVDNLPASQAVTGTVNVGNLPATQTVTGTVNVANAVDHVPAEPFDAQVLFSGRKQQEFFVVPEGKTAVIENVSAFILGQPQWVPVLQVGDTSAVSFSSTLSHWVALTPQGIIPSPQDPEFDSSVWVGTETVRLYLPPGTTVSARLQVAVSQGFDPPHPSGFVNVTGYFVDTPAQPGA